MMRDWFKKIRFVALRLIPWLGRFGSGLEMNASSRSFDDIFHQTLSEHLARKGIDAEDLQQLDVIAQDVLNEATPRIAASVLRTLKRTAGRMLRDHRRCQMGFERRLRGVWGEPLDLLKMLLVAATEAGSDFNAKNRETAAETQDYVFEALTRLHARACQVANEVLVLLQSGYASGAHARWRTVHETAVVTACISKHGADVAERWLLHRAVEEHKAALGYQRHCEAIGHEPLGEDELSALRSARDSAKDRFGAAFMNDHGWAADVLKKKRPSFADVEEDADLGHMRPYYKMASYGIHAGVKCVTFNLGLGPMEEGSLLLCGPSDAGLTDPGHSTAISLLQVTASLLASKPNVERIVTLEVFQRLVDEIGEAFAEADAEVTKMAEADMADSRPSCDRQHR